MKTFRWNDPNRADIEALPTMETAHIIEEAKGRGYTVREVPGGVRIGGSSVTDGPDTWMNAVNVELWKRTISA